MQSDEKIVRFDTSFVNCLIQKETKAASFESDSKFSSGTEICSQNDEPDAELEDAPKKTQYSLKDAIHKISNDTLNDSSLNDSNQNTSNSGFLYDNFSFSQKTSQKNSGSSINNKELNLEEKTLEQFQSSSSNKSKNSSQTPFQQIQKKRRFEPQKEINMFLIDLDKVYDGLDQRTTLMIRNIPNKYNQCALLREFDEDHYDSYDFFYLPIDFQNRCNVGYAFINFQEPRFIPSFYRRFHNKKWRMYNSEKICQLTYARIQGKEALISHFQFSSIMNQKDTKVKPVFFQKNSSNSVKAQKQKLNQSFQGS